MATTTILLKKTAVRILAEDVSDRVIPNPAYMFDAATATHIFRGGGLDARARHADLEDVYGDDVALTWLNINDLAYKIVTYLT